MNNILLAVSCATVLLGTMFPLLVDALGLGMISVGPPYFNALFVPLALLLGFALGIGVLLNWKRSSFSGLLQQVRWIAPVSVLGGVAFALFYADRFIVVEALAIAVVLWLVLTAGRDLLNKTRNARQKNSILASVQKLPASYLGMHLAHIGLAITIIGAAMTSGYSEQRDLRMGPGDTARLGQYTFRFDGVTREQGPNYVTDTGIISVFDQRRQITVLRPEKRIYSVRGMPMTEAGIDPGLTRDIYVALGEPLDGGSWAVRLHIKLYVRLIWLGSIFMALGGLLAVCDKRYRIRLKKKQASLKPGIALGAEV